MSHLSDDELLAAAEGGGGRRGHLDACAACRAEVEELADVLREAAAVEVPEVSPSFWRHFSARVSDAVRQQRVPGVLPRDVDRVRGRTAGLARWATTSLRFVAPAAAVLFLVVVAGRFREPAPGSSDAPARHTAAAEVPSIDPGDEADAVTDEESWRVLSALASEADPADIDLEVPAPGVADVAVSQMTDDEQGELIRLLKAELERGGVSIEG